MKKIMENSLNIDIIKEGSGSAIQSGQTAVVHYIGTFVDGTKFDSSVDRGVPLSFTIDAGEVIKGWDQGVVGMKIGEKRKLQIPPELGYGASGAGGVIPPNAILMFEIDLLEIK